jgi:hypothetical protein
MVPPGGKTHGKNRRREKMFTYQDMKHAHALQCDRCGAQDFILTAKDEGRAREIAERWTWALETPRGDLCPRCAGLWKAGALTAETPVEEGPV